MAKKKAKATTINVGDNVTMHYKCTLEDGTVTGDSYQTGETISFEVGKKTVLSGIDERVVGMAVGDTSSFMLTPAEGYGDYDGDRIGVLPHENFPAEFIPQIQEGSVIPLQSKDGSHRLIGTVKEVGSDTFTVDFNHPLAGQVLTFDVEIVSINDDAATTTEGAETATTTTEGTEDAATE
jgi:FKBP-type peptidyl-prolyl cis-trans isomerase 2